MAFKANPFIGIAIVRLALLGMSRSHRSNGRVGRVTDEASIPLGFRIQASVFEPVGKEGRFAADCRKEDEDPDNSDNNGYKDQVFLLHTS